MSAPPPERVPEAERADLIRVWKARRWMAVYRDGIEQAIQATPTKPTLPPTPDAAQAATMQSAPVPAATPAPVSTPAVNAGGQIYVPGFGWVQSSGANSEGNIGDMYENGNKVGEMG